MLISALIRNFAETNGYDGLFNEGEGCYCLLDINQSCLCPDCELGRKALDPSKESGYIVLPGSPYPRDQLEYDIAMYRRIVREIDAALGAIDNPPLPYPYQQGKSIKFLVRRLEEQQETITFLRADLDNQKSD